MNKILRFAICFVVLTVSCAPQAVPTQSTHQATATSQAATLTTEHPTETAPAPSLTVTPTLALPAWPIYTLAATLPDAPAQARLYTQDFPVPLPEGERLDALMKKLKMTGPAVTSISEGGLPELLISGGAGNITLFSDDPLDISIANMSKLPANSTPVKILPLEVRAQVAKAFLDERGLLDFPYTMELQTMLNERDQTLLVVPLIDGIPLHDIHYTNRRLQVWFDAAGEISSLRWNPLKLTAGELVSIIPAVQAWDEFVHGKTSKKDNKQQCWRATVYDATLPLSGGVSLTRECDDWGRLYRHLRYYDAATVSNVKLVYFAYPLIQSAPYFLESGNAPYRAVFPMWEFSGSTSDNRQLVVLWPATDGK